MNKENKTITISARSSDIGSWDEIRMNLQKDLEAAGFEGNEIIPFLVGAEEIFAGKKEESEEFDDMLRELLRFYEKGYERWLKGEIRPEKD